MTTEINAPMFPESIEEGTVMTWYKQVGDLVAADEKLADIETDKVVLEVAAPSAGTLEQLIKAEGDTVLSGERIALLGDGVAAAPAVQPKPAPAAMPEPPLPPALETQPAPLRLPREIAQEGGEAAAIAPVPPAAPDDIGISPSARLLVQEHGLDPTKIQGSGRQGRISKADVLAHIDSNGPAALLPPAPQEAAAPTPAPPIPETGDVRSERMPMSRIRVRIAQRLVEAQQTAAILTTFNEINMKPVIDLRNRHKEEFEKKHGVRLGFMSFFVKAAIEALKRFPDVNASIEGTDIIRHHYYNIGIAVSSPRGLVVPVLRDADRLAFHEIEAAIRESGKRAQDNQLQIEDLQGGTFTISNGGVFGSMLSTPILNPPQTGILGMHAITDRAVVEEGEIVVRPMMYLALSYDHRLVDGRGAVLFLVTLKELLEDPARMLLQV